MSNTVDPKRVLKIINSMGYKNVSAQELKQFTNGKFIQIHYSDAFFNEFSFYFRLEKTDEI